MATSEEIGKLNLSELNPTRSSKCIYGQMTGSCASDRAKELMEAACIRVMDLPGGPEDVTGKIFAEYSHWINGKNENKTWESASIWSRRNYSYSSVLEAYIATKDAKNEHILSFLKGEIEILNLQ